MMGAPTVLIGMMPAARVGDMAVCVGPPDVIVKGSPTVNICGMMAARVGDFTSHGGTIVAGFPTVNIGEIGMGGAFTTQGKALARAKESGQVFVEHCDVASEAGQT
jgi:hypothetical protein